MELFGYTFMQNAIMGVILVSIASAIIGTYIVTRRMVFISGGITHACFGGLGLGYFLGVSPILTAMIFAVGSGLGVEWLTGKNKVREDSAIGVIWGLGMAIGTIFIFMTPGYVQELNSFLFGSILTISYPDLIAFAVFTAVLILMFSLFFRTIIACGFDPDFARTLRLPVKLINGLMIVMVSVCIVLTIRMIGIMLLMSLFTIPQIIAELYYTQYKKIMVTSVIVCVCSGLLGLFTAFFLDVPVSATIVLTLVAVYAVARAHKTLLERRKCPAKQ